MPIPLFQISTTVAEAPLTGTSLKESGVTGIAVGNIGVSGTSQAWASLEASQTAGVTGVKPATITDGVYGMGQNGVHGVCSPSVATSSGVLGENADGPGVSGTSTNNHGVHGTNQEGAGAAAAPNRGCGVWGESGQGYGVYGASTSFTGVYGTSTSGLAGEFTGNVQVTGELTSTNGAAFPCIAISGSSSNGHGLYGRNQQGAGSAAAPTRGCGVWGESGQGYGVYGASTSSTGVYGTSTSGLAGEFEGNVGVSGNVSVSGNLTLQGNVSAADVIIAGADCAEDFELTASCPLEPGTVVVLDDHGAVGQSYQPYDKRVAGVVSGAGSYRPGVILGRAAGPAPDRAPIALMGRVFCKVDASHSPIEVGDLLTTSPTPGTAMKATDIHRSFGTIIGKALSRHIDGPGLIPILVSLQ